MSWLATTPATADLCCEYCGERGSFTLSFRYAYMGHEQQLWRCPGCGSLAYHPLVGRIPVPKEFSTDYRRNVEMGAKYYLEAGYNDIFVTQCVMSAIAPVPQGEIQDHLFVDIGAGLGMSSLLARSVFGAEVIAVEPSYSSQLGRELLGIPIHNAFVENLPQEVRATMRKRPCLLHLNSVIEHLEVPAEALRSMMREARVATLAAIVPDGAAIDGAEPFGSVLGLLAPGDHLHLPSEEGMRRLFSRLGFAHVEVRAHAGLLVAVGAHVPFVLPSDDEVHATSTTFHENLLQAPNPAVSGGAAARLLPHAVLSSDTERLARLRAFFATTLNLPELHLALERARGWGRVPFHLPTTAFWLGAEAFQRKAPQEGFAWWDMMELATDRLVADHPIYAMKAVDHRWESRIMRGYHLADLGQPNRARAWLSSVIASTQDHMNGPIAGQVQRARERLDGPWAQTAVPRRLRRSSGPA